MACAASPAPPTARSRVAPAFKFRTTSTSNFRSSRVLAAETFGSVVDKAKVSDAVVNEALNKGGDVGVKVSTNPASITGKVLSATNGAGVAGVQVTRSHSACVEIALRERHALEVSPNALEH